MSDSEAPFTGDIDTDRRRLLRVGGTGALGLAGCIENGGGGGTGTDEPGDTATSATESQQGTETTTDGTPRAANRAHPFLICERSQFQELRERANEEPWTSMRQKAVERAEAGLGDDGTPDSPIHLHRYLGAEALLYILEPANRRERAAKVRDGITEGLDAIAFDPSQRWRGTVPPMGAAFVAILALDIVYADLPSEEIGRCEGVIERQIGNIDRTGSWPAGRLGTHGTWDVYRGEREEQDYSFYNNYQQQMTEDGVTTVAPTYAFARLGSGDSRPQKTGYADVLEFTGIDQRYYDNPKLNKFYRWLFSSSVDPARQFHMFGDTIVTSGQQEGALFWRVGQFDQQAAAYAAWYLEEEEPPGHLLSYVLMEEPLPEPEVPTSQLFDDGGAVFREPEDRPTALGSALYNITENAQYHSHQETNAIACSAYGARLLVNGGWLGPKTRPPWRNNTVSIDRAEHNGRMGAGLVEGLLGDGFDYACGDAGQALRPHTFRRSLVQVHGEAGPGGYFVTFDEFEASPDATIKSYVQLATETEPSVLVDGQEYQAVIDHHTDTEGVECAVCYPAEPESVTTELVPSGKIERSPEFGKHYRLSARYSADSDGSARLPTILFPSDPDHPKAELTPIDVDGVTGATVEQADGTTDVLFQAAGAEAVTAEDVTARAQAVVRRPGDDGFYFARRGRSLDAAGEGFEAADPLSIFMRGASGRFTAQDPTTLSLTYPGVTGVRLDGEAVDGADAEGETVEFDVPAGRHELTIETDS
jgi:hypothetical protein